MRSLNIVLNATFSVPFPSSLWVYCLICTSSLWLLMRRQRFQCDCAPLVYQFSPVALFFSPSLPHSSPPTRVCISLMYFGGSSQSSLFAQGHITSHFAGQILSRNLREFHIWLFEIAKIRPSCLKPRVRNPRF